MTTDAKVMKPEGFSTFAGVFVPNVMMMFGVILFMRLSLVVGSVGIWQFAGIMAISLILMSVTSSSITMIATNMQVGSGGAYYIISRSLGMEIGGAFGLALIANQLICLCLCVSGFTYSVAVLFPNISVELVEIGTLSLLTLLSCLSSDLALRCQMFIFALLLGSIATIFISSPVYVGSTEPFFAQPLTFWQAFAIFYPAMTGIEAGMAMSGTLRDPSYSLSKGNLWSLLFAGALYIVIALFLFNTYSLEALQANPNLILQQSRIPAIIYLGIWAASLSTVLGNLLASSQMLQTVAEDGIVPRFLAKTYGPLKEPRIALAAIFMCGSVLVLFTTIDTILPILTMICLLTYTVLNTVAGLCELVQSPTWRPTTSYPWQLCFFGAALGLLLMFIIDTVWATGAIVALAGIYFLLKSRNHEANFHDFRQTILMYISRLFFYHINAAQDHAFHWLPHIAVFTRGVTNPPKKMIRLASSITRRSGLLTLTSIIPESENSPEQTLQVARQFLSKWVANQSIQCLNDVKAYDRFDTGIDSMIRAYGTGPLFPNTLMLPLDNSTSDEEISYLVRIISAAQENNKNIVLFNDPPATKDAAFSRRNICRRKIDIWWSVEAGDTFELMLSLVLSTRSSVTWRNRDVLIRAVASDSKAQGYLHEHFGSLMKKIRFKATPKVTIAVSDSSKSEMQIFSQTADLIFAPLKPITAFESTEAYSHYLKDFLKGLPAHIASAIVTSYDAVNHKEVYLNAN